MKKGPDGKPFVNSSDRSGHIMCDDFMKHEITEKAGLTLEEVIALRLYTGPAFQKYNQHLRGLSEDLGGTRKLARAKTERQYTTTIHAIASALKKVARVTKLPEVNLPSQLREASASALVRCEADLGAGVDEQDRRCFFLTGYRACLSVSRARARALSLSLSLSLALSLFLSLTVRSCWTESWLELDGVRLATYPITVHMQQDRDNWWLWFRGSGLFFLSVS